MKQLVLPTRDTNVLHEVEDILLHNSREGRWNYTIFRAGRATLFRVSDVLTPERNEIYKTNGDIKKNAHIHDKETGKPNILYLKPIK